MQLAAHAKSSTLHGRSCGNLEPRVILAPCQRYGRRIMTSEIIDDWFVYEDLPLFIKKTLRKVIVRKFKFFHFKVVRVCSFVCCNGMCKSCLSFPKTKFEWYTPTRHKEISCSFMQFTVQMSKLNGLGKTHRERIFVVELKLKLRSLFHHEKIVWENSDIKWMNVPSFTLINCNQIPHVLTF